MLISQNIKPSLKMSIRRNLLNTLKLQVLFSYRLAEPQNLQRVSLTEADRKAGAVEKIRLKTTVEQLLLEVNLFGQVNEKYLQKVFWVLMRKNLLKRLPQRLLLLM